MNPIITLPTALPLASLALLHAADTPPGVMLESRGLPLVLFNNDGDDLKWPAYPEHHASGLWVPGGPYLPLPKIHSLDDALAPRIGTLARTRTQGLAYCGNFGLPIWELKRDHIAALGDDPLQPILQFWKRDGRTFFFSMRMNDIHHAWFNWAHLWSHFRRTHRDLLLQPPTDTQWEREFVPWIEGKTKRPDISDSSMALDYSRAEVRAYYLDTLRDACHRYDLDGVELDWLRYPCLFREGEVNVETMTAFVRKARGVLDETAKRRGHPVRLLARVPVTPEQALAIGLDVEARSQLLHWLWADADVTLSRGELIDEPDDADEIPLAPRITSEGGLTIRRDSGFNGSLRYRLIGDRPANEDDSVTALGHFVLNADLGYLFDRWQVQLSLENLLDTDWNEAQFDTESRLPAEEESVSELHFTPGNPRSARLGLSYLF